MRRRQEPHRDRERAAVAVDAGQHHRRLARPALAAQHRERGREGAADGPALRRVGPVDHCVVERGVVDAVVVPVEQPRQVPGQPHLQEHGLGVDQPDPPQVPDAPNVAAGDCRPHRRPGLVDLGRRHLPPPERRLLGQARRARVLDRPALQRPEQARGPEPVGPAPPQVVERERVNLLPAEEVAERAGPLDRALGRDEPVDKPHRLELGVALGGAVGGAVVGVGAVAPGGDPVDDALGRGHAQTGAAGKPAHPGNGRNQLGAQPAPPPGRRVPPVDPPLPGLARQEAVEKGIDWVGRGCRGGWVGRGCLGLGGLWGGGGCRGWGGCPGLGGLWGGGLGRRGSPRTKVGLDLGKRLGFGAEALGEPVLLYEPAELGDTVLANRTRHERGDGHSCQWLKKNPRPNCHDLLV